MIVRMIYSRKFLSLKSIAFISSDKRAVSDVGNEPVILTFHLLFFILLSYFNITSIICAIVIITVLC